MRWKDGEIYHSVVYPLVFDFGNFFQINFKHYTKGALDPIGIKCEKIFQNGPSKLNLFKF